MGLALRDFGISYFWGLSCVAMDSVTAEFAAYFLRDSTSPKLQLVVKLQRITGFYF